MADVFYGPHSSAGTYAPGMDLQSSMDQQYQQTGRIPEGWEVKDGHLQRIPPSFWERNPWLVPLIFGGAATGGAELASLAGFGGAGAASTLGPSTAANIAATSAAEAAPAGIAAGGAGAAGAAAAGAAGATTGGKVLQAITAAAPAAAGLAINHAHGNGAPSSSLSPEMQALLQQLLQLATDRIQSTTPIHQAAMAMAQRLAPNYARAAMTTPSATPSTPGGGMTPAQIAALQAMARGLSPAPAPGTPMAVPRT